MNHDLSLLAMDNLNSCGIGTKLMCDPFITTFLFVGMLKTEGMNL